MALCRQSAAAAAGMEVAVEASKRVKGRGFASSGADIEYGYGSATD
jgi:hypothetical protein